MTQLTIKRQSVSGFDLTPTEPKCKPPFRSPPRVFPTEGLPWLELQISFFSISAL